MKHTGRTEYIGIELCLELSMFETLRSSKRLLHRRSFKTNANLGKSHVLMKMVDGDQKNAKF